MRTVCSGLLAERAVTTVLQCWETVYDSHNKDTLLQNCINRRLHDVAHHQWIYQLRVMNGMIGVIMLGHWILFGMNWFRVLVLCKCALWFLFCCHFICSFLYRFIIICTSLSINIASICAVVIDLSLIQSVDLCVCVSGKCIVAKWLIGSGCCLRWSVGLVKGWVY